MNKRIYFFISVSAISILLAACTNNAAQEPSTSVELNHSISQETSQSTTLDKQDEMTTSSKVPVSNSEQENSSEVQNTSTIINNQTNNITSTNYSIPDNVIEFANYYVETSVRADPRAYGLSTRFGRSYISPNIPQYIYENNQIRPYSELPIYLLFYNKNAVQFISNTRNYGGDCYPELTEFLKKDDKVCIIISGNKCFAKSKDNSLEIDDFTNLLGEVEPEVTPEIINNIESDQIEFMPLKKYFLKEYRPQPPKLKKSTEIERLDYNQKQYDFEDYCDTYMDEDTYGGYASDGDVVILYYLDLEKVKAVAKQYVPDWDKSGVKYVKDSVKVKYRQAKYSMTFLKQVKQEVYKELTRQGIEDPFINIYNNQLTISLFEEEIPKMKKFLKTYEHRDSIVLHNASADIIPCT